ncbi:MAG: outer membrane beta-barrel protein [Chloroflexota bacterium]
MKKYLTAFALIFFTVIVPAAALPLTDIGFHVGLSTPNDKINDVYNKGTIGSDTLTGTLYNKGVTTGYHLALKARLGLSDMVSFVGGIGINRFPESKIDVIDPKNGDTLARLTTTTNVVPISAGVNIYLLKSVIGLYGTGELTYNYITSSVDANWAGKSIPISNSPSDSRMGFGVGAGVDLDLQIVLLNLEAKYHYLNLIGKDEDEGAKNYLAVSLGVYF